MLKCQKSLPVSQSLHNSRIILIGKQIDVEFYVVQCMLVVNISQLKQRKVSTWCIYIFV